MVPLTVQIVRRIKLHVVFTKIGNIIIIVIITENEFIAVGIKHKERFIVIGNIVVVLIVVLGGKWRVSAERSLF